MLFAFQSHIRNKLAMQRGKFRIQGVCRHDLHFTVRLCYSPAHCTAYYLRGISRFYTFKNFLNVFTSVRRVAHAVLINKALAELYVEQKTR